MENHCGSHMAGPSSPSEGADPISASDTQDSAREAGICNGMPIQGRTGLCDRWPARPHNRRRQRGKGSVCREIRWPSLFAEFGLTGGD